MTNDDDLSSQEVVELVTKYLENVMLTEMRKRLEEHVEDCPAAPTIMNKYNSVSACYTN
jgi:hypothetical protein